MSPTSAEIKQMIDQSLPDASEEAKSALVTEYETRARMGDSAPRTVSAGRVGLRSGQVSELTVIAPLKQGGADRLRMMLGLAGGSFAAADRVGTVHDMRFVVLPGDEQLLFATAFDGDWDSYINDFATKIPVEMDLLFGQVEGWPGIHDPSVKDFISQYQHTADGWYVASPDLTVADTRRLERTGKALDDFLDKIGSD